MARWLRALAWLSGLALLLAVVITLQKPHIDSDILALMPQSDTRIDNVEAHFFAANKQQVMFSITGGSAKQVHDKLNKWLIDNGLPARFNVPRIDTLSQFYAPYAGRLLSEEYLAALENQHTFSTFYNQKLSQLADPFVSATINLDASLSLASFLTEQMQNLQTFNLEENRLTAIHHDAKYYLLFAQISDNAFGIEQAQQLSTSIEQQLQQLAVDFPQTQVRYSGAVFHTSANASQAKYEMTLFGTLSLLALITMIVWVFRSSVALWLASLTVLSAIFGGAAVLLVVFSQVHILTLVFAVTLIGIAIDYSFHGMLDLSSGKQKGYSRGLKLALLLSLLTTSLGYASLFFSPMLLLAQVGVFVVAGLFCAWLCTLLITRQWQHQLIIAAPILNIADKLSVILLHWLQLRRYVILASIGLITACYLHTPVSLNNDVRLLNASPQALIENEAFHLSLLGQDNGRIMIMFADDEQALLEQLTRFKVALQLRSPDAKLNVLSDLLPSRAMQERNSVLVQAKQNQGVFTASESISGQPFSVSTITLTLDALLTSPLAPLVEQQVMRGDEFVASWFMVTDVPMSVLADFASADPQLLIYNKVALLSEGLTHYSHSLFITLGCALLLAAFLFAWRFKMKCAFKQSAVLVLTIAIILSLCSVLQGSLSIFNLLGSLLVMALSIDYLVFYQINQLSRENIIAISLSAASSMWVFGMLAMSITPAIYSFGLTIMIGLVAIFVLAPLTLDVPKSKENR
ncbi:transporter [Pseudoalteromonas arctica]|uniref:Transporter n=1 Tax=Pseudoalteromonas arctica TaxID=394751 RepID=A0A7Y0DVT3_9GAMM|nr:transporter [Pseudoalteromonas arctica]NMM42423.1 transporter [Pseudoalteromonas arctica]